MHAKSSCLFEAISKIYFQAPAMKDCCEGQFSSWMKHKSSESICTLWLIIERGCKIKAKKILYQMLKDHTVITKQEALAIVWIVKCLLIYLYGVHFTFVTNCKPVELIMNNPQSRPSNQEIFCADKEHWISAKRGLSSRRKNNEIIWKYASVYRTRGVWDRYEMWNKLHKAFWAGRY